MSTSHLIAQNTFKDEFNTPSSLENWEQLEIEGWSSKVREVKVEDNKLVLEPTSSGWFEDNFAGFLYREYTGNFQLTSKVKVEGTVASFPETLFSLAGLFIRAPRKVTAATWERGKENWMFFSTGSATDAGKPQFEIKSTYNSQSTLKIFPSKETWMELKIVRVDEIFTLLYKYEGEEWQILDQFIRPDLPETLQVGITAYSDWSSLAKIYPSYEKYNVEGTLQDKGDLRAHFDYVSIEPCDIKKEVPIANFIGQQVLSTVQKD